MFSNLCVFGKCENIYGMFRCICDKGFTLDESGGNCTDIDECENPQACQYGNCINSQGSYVCQCPPHHELIPSQNGCVGKIQLSSLKQYAHNVPITLFLDKRVASCFLGVKQTPAGRNLCEKELGDPISRSTCCCSVGKAWGPQCELCPAPDTDEFKALCPAGSGFRPNMITVIILNEIYLVCPRY